MLIYGSFIIAVLVTIGLLIFKRQKFIWFEALIMIIAPLLLVIGSKALIETTQTNDAEFWGSYVTGGIAEQRWNEYIQKKCSQEHCSGSGKDRSCYTTYYDCSYIEDHPPIWKLWDNIGNTFHVSAYHWENIARKFNSRVWKEMARNYHTIDGDAHTTQYPNTPQTLEAVVTEHTYENRVAVSDSLYRFRKVENPKALGLYDYPPIVNPYYQDVIIGDKSGLQDLSQVEWSFKYLNGVLGFQKQIKIFVILFNNKSVQTAMDQQAFWSGGNKNEFIICIGRNGNDITWVYPFSWQDNKQLDIETRDFVQNLRKINPETLNTLAGWLEPQVNEHWKRKRFRDFSYLSVEPPIWTVVGTYVLTFLIVGGIAFWSIRNEFDNEGVEDLDIQSYWERILISFPHNTRKILDKIARK